jgi:hypothetical protein
MRTYIIIIGILVVSGLGGTRCQPLQHEPHTAADDSNLAHDPGSIAGRNELVQHDRRAGNELEKSRVRDEYDSDEEKDFRDLGLWTIIGILVFVAVVGLAACCCLRVRSSSMQTHLCYRSGYQMFRGIF